MKEIERKFLIKNTPQINPDSKIEYERYFIGNNPHKQIRLQRKNDLYELETKELNKDSTYNKIKKQISKAEFEESIKGCQRKIVRTSYKIIGFADATLKIYKEQFSGLVRAEFEFQNIEQANNFTPPTWLGKEITDCVLGMDAKLVNLTRQEFLAELQSMV